MQNSSNSRVQQKFLEEYSKTLDIAKAARKAGYTKKTGIANATNFLKTPKNQKALYSLCEAKTGHLEVCLGYVVENYLKILKWAVAQDDTGKPNDPALALRALEGLTKQLGWKKEAFENVDVAQMPIINSITNLDPTKI